ncbi:acyl carrier protein [Streptomyces sp. NPDC048278]|uniref:acyl carrier protein n=1 Tax=Streptomyces sp. NPDC048278 TaxID=3155809 RepID=UPI003427808E
MPIAVQEIQDVLRRHIAEILYCDPEEIADDVLFSELGLDSILSAELSAVINQEYAIRADIEVIHQHPSVGRLAAYVAANAG